MNYFEFYGLQVKLNLDLSDLKKQFYAKSRELHPDFHSNATQEEQLAIIEKASFNNKAFETLADFNLRIKYILELYGILAEEGKNEIPQSFLMEMMEFNEGIMDLELDFSEHAFNILQEKINSISENKYANMQDIMDLSLTLETDPIIFSRINDYYLETRYLSRIQDHLNRVKSQHQ